jgi:hypothetical protein
MLQLVIFLFLDNRRNDTRVILFLITGYVIIYSSLSLWHASCFKQSAMKKTTTPYLFLATLLILLTLAYRPAVAAVDVHYRYALANFSGPLKSFQAKLAISRKADEVFVFDPVKKDIRIFNEHGMEIFSLGEEDEFAWLRDFTVDDESNVYVLFRDFRSNGIPEYNFRGDLVNRIKVQNLSAEFVDLDPSIIVWRQDRLYLVDVDTLRIVVLDQEGMFQTGYAVLTQVREAALSLSRKKQKNPILDMFGFNVDDHGNMFFTVPMIASVFRVRPDGRIDRFGKAGSSAGQFGVVSGVAVDEHGYIYVSDRLRCVVMVFDKEFNFVSEFGYRGYGPSNLIVPSDVAVYNGNIFVSQAANRGVSCFRITSD